MRIDRPSVGRLLAAAALAIAIAGCGEATPPPPDGRPLGPLVVTVFNKGTDAKRPLEELKLHARRDDHVDAQNLLQQPLALEESAVFEDLAPGRYHLTVVRKSLGLDDADRVAITTAEPISLHGGHVVIWVFDESFRVFDPTPTSELGVPDAGVDLLDDAGVDARDGGDASDVMVDVSDGGDDALRELGSDQGGDATRDGGDAYSLRDAADDSA